MSINTKESFISLKDKKDKLIIITQLYTQHNIYFRHKLNSIMIFVYTQILTIVVCLIVQNPSVQVFKRTNTI